MKAKLLIPGLLGGLLCVQTAAQAQNRPGPNDRPGGQPNIRELFLKQFDKNGNGRIEENERPSREQIPVGPVVVPVPVTRINAQAAPANALANGPVDDRVSLAKVAKVGAPVSEAPARVDSPEARAGAQVAPVANSPLAVLWLKHWMPTVTVSFLPLN